MSFNGIDAKYIFEKLQKGSKIVACDFETMRMLDCGDMKISALQALMEKPGVKFFEGVEIE